MQTALVLCAMAAPLDGQTTDAPGVLPAPCDTAAPILLALSASPGDFQARKARALRLHVDKPWPKVDTDWGLFNFRLAQLSLDAPTNASLAAEISADVATWASRYAPFPNFTVEGPLSGLGELPVLARMALQPRLRRQLTASALDSLQELLLGWLSPRSVAAWVADPGSWLVVDGSENLDATRKASCYLAALALNLTMPQRTLEADGRTVAEHAAAWEAHWRQYLLRRAGEGLGMELGSPTYAKYSLQVPAPPLHAPIPALCPHLRPTSTLQT